MLASQRLPNSEICERLLWRREDEPRQWLPASPFPAYARQLLFKSLLSAVAEALRVFP